VAVAASSVRHDDETSGTVTLGNGVATVRVIVSPAATCVLRIGALLEHGPLRFRALPRRWRIHDRETERFELRLRRLERLAGDVGQRERLRGVLVVEELCDQIPARREQGEDQQSDQDAQPHLAGRALGLGGGITCVGDGRAMTCVASPAPASSGVASTS
jgi:hypothetical protein